MPNWCDCELTITGPVEELIRFREGVNRSADKPYLDILASYYPVPQALEGILTGYRREEDGAWIDIYSRVQRDGKRIDLSLEERKTLARRYGASSANEWRCAFWGSKWGDCHTELCAGLEDAESPDALVYFFDGAWNCPCPGFREVSKQFPLLTFSITYHEERMGFAGSYVCRNGKVLKNSVVDTLDSDEKR